MPELATRRHFLVGAAVFGLVPSVSGVSWMMVALVALTGGALSVSWQFRLLILFFAVPEACGLPWPTACFASAVALMWIERSRSMHLIHWRRSTTRLGAWARLGSLGAVCGGVVVILDAPRIEAGYVFPLPLPPPALLPALVVGVALINSVGEELLWRGVLVRLGRGENGAPLSVVAQALSFGAAHYFGIPQGIAGVAAAAIFSALIYKVSRRYGFTGALIVHFVTDLVIFFAVMPRAQFAWSG